MFEHINTRICWKLALREIRFHKMRSIPTILVAVLEAAVFSFVLFVASSAVFPIPRQIFCSPG